MSKQFHRRGAALLPIFGVGLAAGCGPAQGADPVADDEVVTAQEPLTREIPGEVELLSRFRFTNPELTLRGYASSVTTWSMCSGAMIGPSILMTAGHCGRTDVNVPLAFTVYPYTDPYKSATETFACRSLVSLFADSDLHLMYCDANAAGEKPGDKYGYLDFFTVTNPDGTFNYDSSYLALFLYPTVIDVWRNNIVEPTPYNYAAWVSYGGNAVPSMTTSWFGVNGGCAAVSRLTGAIDLWGKSGISGSSILNASTYRIQYGPNSGASCSGASDKADGCAGIAAAPIIDQLKYGFVYLPNAGADCDGKSRKQLHASNIQGLGLTPTNYEFKRVDNDNDGVFDVQGDLESLTGETARKQYWLGFESARRNRLWVRQSTDINIPLFDSRFGSAVSAAGAFRDVLKHPKLNLPGGKKYQFSVSVRSTSSAAPVFGVQLNEAIGGSATSTTQRMAGTLTTTTAGQPLKITGDGGFEFWNLTLVEQGSTHTFDTHDSRMMWTSTSGSGFIGAAPILPAGNGTTANWALAVRKATAGFNKAWVQSVDIGFPSPGNVRVCFEHKTGEILSMTSATAGRLFVNDKTGLNKVTYAFTPTTTWTQSCTGWFTTTAVSAILFGTYSTNSNAGIGEGYLVDNFRIEKQ
jgi:hypothetical protein